MKKQTFNYHELENSFPSPINNILDIGCVGKHFYNLIKSHYHEAKIYGVDCGLISADPEARVYEAVVRMNLENHDFPYEENYFDVIIYANILDQLRDPWQVLKLHTKYLKENGVIIIRLPNIHFYRIYQTLNSGQWNYTDGSFPNMSHLRFFGKKNMEELIAQAGLDIVSTHRMMGGSNKRNFYNRVLGGIWNDGLTEQYIFVCKKGTEP